MKSISRKSLVAAVLAASMVVGCGDDDTTPPPTNPPTTNPPTTDPPPAQTNTIVDAALGNPAFSTLVAALQKADLVQTLQGDGPFTVFAPTNEAFAASGITDLDAFSAEELRTVLLYHVIAGASVTSSQVAAGPVDSAADLTFFLGTSEGVTINGGNTVAGGASVATADVSADNGVIHVIDRVMLPPTVAGCAIYGGLTELVGAIGAAADLPGDVSVLDALNGNGPFTVFAPTNEAFAAITAPSDPATLRDILLYHVIPGRVGAGAIPAKADSLLTNKWGHGVSMLFNTAGGASVNGAEISATDIKCTNGIVHLVDSVLLPPNVVQMATIAGLTELLGAVGAAADLPGGTAVADALAADAPYTVLAPTNAAFQAITVPTDSAVLRDVLLLHVIQADAPVLSSGLPSVPVSTLNAGAAVSFDGAVPSVSSDGTTSAAIGPFDIHVTNGVVHVIDKVLLP